MDTPNSIIPGIDEPEFASYHAFINAKLRQIYELGQEVLPTLGYEFRVDKDPLQHPDGSVSWLENDNYIDTEGLRYSYWAPFIGATNQGEKLDATQALNLLDYNLREQTKDGSNTRLIIDQFNFVDDTFKYTGSNARLAESEIEPFLQACAELLPRYCKGYGIWAWRDYFQNHLFNPGFQLGLRGWELHVAHSIGRRLGRKGLCLNAGDAIAQSFPSAAHGMHKKYKTSHLLLRVEIASSKNLVMEASLNQEHYFPLVWDGQVACYCANLPIDDPVYGKRGVLFSLRVVAGTVTVSTANLFQYHYQVGIRATDGRPGPFLGPLRQLNRDLSLSSTEL